MTAVASKLAKDEQDSWFLVETLLLFLRAPSPNNNPSRIYMSFSEDLLVLLDKGLTEPPSSSIRKISC